MTANTHTPNTINDAKPSSAKPQSAKPQSAKPQSAKPPSAKPKSAISTSAAAPKKLSTRSKKALYDLYKQANTTAGGAKSKKPRTSSSKTNDTTAVPKSNTKLDTFRSDFMKRYEDHLISKKSEKK